MKIKLANIAADETGGLDKDTAEKELKDLIKEMADLQNVMYASKQASLLIVLQGMDASGKDGLIRNVFSGVNPQGCVVKSFKAPTEEECSHDFLWRIHPHAPAKGMFQLFNRSHYEDILYPTVHKTFSKDEIKRRYTAINHFEEHLQSSGTVILKFYLHISPKEQAERLQKRIEDPTKHWKYNAADKIEAGNWEKYMAVYEKIFEKCGKAIPWHIVPADNKWYRNVVIARKVVETLKALDMKYPGFTEEQKEG